MSDVIPNIQFVEIPVDTKKMDGGDYNYYRRRLKSKVKPEADFVYISFKIKNKKAGWMLDGEFRPYLDVVFVKCLLWLQLEAQGHIETPFLVIQKDCVDTMKEKNEEELTKFFSGLAGRRVVIFREI